MVRNPYNQNYITEYKLNPSVVDLICFCTKNPAPLLTDEAQKLLSPYRQFWFITITPYGRAYEPSVPDKLQVIESFRTLSKIVSPQNISWRYDPVFIYDKYTVEQHKISFEKLCKELSGFTNECIFSFIDIYEKVKKNFPEVQPVSKEMQFELSEYFTKTAACYGIKTKICCENPDLKKTGADITGCMTKELYERASGSKLNLKNAHKARKECSCYLGCDIGQYNTCAHFCRYCYANYSHDIVLKNMNDHNPNSPLLIGVPGQNDIIHQANQISWKMQQTELNF